MGLPSRGYRWADATTGNTIAEKHGAYSPRKVDPLAEQFAHGLLALAEGSASLDYVAKPEFRHAVWAWARAEARVQLLHEWLADRPPLNPKGNPWPASKQLEREEASAAARRQVLGLDPLSRARLGRDVNAASLDAARLFAQLSEESATTGTDDAEGVVEGPEMGS